MKQPIYHRRHRFLAINNNFGENGRYTKDIEWIVNSEYNATSDPIIATAFARWIKSLGAVDMLRFDGEGDGSFADTICRDLDLSMSDSVTVSEFSPALRKKIEEQGFVKKENIIHDALIPPDDGGTMVVIANQFLDALPFAVMRRRVRGVILEELTVEQNGNLLSYGYQRLVNASLHEDADLVADSRNGLFAYSPAKINYINNILSRKGKTYLAVIDYSGGKLAEEYANDTRAIAYSPTSPTWLMKMAKKHGGSVVYSDYLVMWPFLRKKNHQNRPIGWHNLTILEVYNEEREKNVCI